MSQTSESRLKTSRELLQVPTLEGQPAEIFPIEWFRDRSSAYFLGGKVVREFRSSGTTDIVRAQSLFSDQGLDRYRDHAVNGFAAALQRRFGWRLQETVGFSLIPTTREWPESSLAQMLNWLADEVPVRFITAETLATAVKLTTKPFWIFGTAFHWVNAIDESMGFRLPSHGVVIETGGTKGRSRSITPEELRQDLWQTFAIPRDRIVSEYGMGELACQAYDDISGNGRLFRFPDSVRPSVLCDTGIVQRSGDGLLIVDDGGRVDFPWPIRTQDLVRLHNDGSFNLLGRYQYAPLKGCSMQAEELISVNQIVDNKPGAVRHVSVAAAAKAPNVAALASGFLSRMREFLHSSRWHAAVRQEFPEASIAHLVTMDLLASIPDSDEQLNASIERSELNPQTAWVFVAPNNHGIALFEALIIAAAAGCEICVRLPRDEKATLVAFLEFLHLENVTLNLRNASWRIDASSLSDSQSLLVFGTTETVKMLSMMYPGRVAGHGHVVGIAGVKDSQVEITALIRDAFSMAQRGCMSTRICLTPAADLNSFVNCCLEEADKFLAGLLPSSIVLNGHFERSRLFPVGTAYVSELGATFLVMQETEIGRECFETLASRHSFVLPIVKTTSTIPESFVKIAKHYKNPTIVFSACKDGGLAEKMVQNSYGNCAFRLLGTVHSHKWNGFHLTTPIFRIT